MKNPNLSRVTRHLGNNFDQYMMVDIDVNRMKGIRQDFNEVLKSYDHDLDDAVVVESKCPIMQAFWIAAIADETMDFSIPFIRFTTMALNDAVLTFCAAQQEEHGGLDGMEALFFEGTFSFTAQGGQKKGPELNVPQHLWNAMIDRDVANHYSETYIFALMKEEVSSDTPPPNSHLH